MRIVRPGRAAPTGAAALRFDCPDGAQSMLDYVLDTKRKRHITGGLLLSGALLFGGLAMTVMSIRDDEEDEDE